MPILTQEQTRALIEELRQNVTLVSLNLDMDTQRKAEEEYDEYIKNDNKDINDMNPLAVYYIIINLEEEEQIKFIKENIKYIKEHDEDIFLYQKICPRSLSYFLSFNALKELKNIDENIFKKVINGNKENLFNGFSHKDYCDLYKEFYDELMNFKNGEFIDGIALHDGLHYTNFNFQNVDNLKSVIEQQEISNKEFICLVLEKYKDKISTFTDTELLNFLKYIDDIDLYKEFLNEYHKKINDIFNDISQSYLDTFLHETGRDKQEILMSNFFENIIKKHDIKQTIYSINPNCIIDLYNNQKDIFNELTLEDWVKVCAKHGILDDNFKKILDSFNIENIESLFNPNFYIDMFYRRDASSLKYIEEKYRGNIKTNGILEEIDMNTSIFSDKYFKNLNELKEMLQNNLISKNNEQYKKHLELFINYLKKENIIIDVLGTKLHEVEKIFYKIVKGKTLASLYELTNIREITLLNRLGKIDFPVDSFTVEQLENYNVKHHKQLYKFIEEYDWKIGSYKYLILKLMFMVGFNNAKVILETDDSITTLEHLVGNVDVKNVILDKYGNPILNTKLMNLLFSDKDYFKIKEMLLNKDNDLYKYFPRIFNEWKIIKMNDKDKSLKMIIDFLKSGEIILAPKYYRLEGLFKFIGCKNSIVNETLTLHDQMLKRATSTIPRVEGKKGEYSYEILRLDDMNALTVGNRTNCCFTVLGAGYSCLKHALTSRNGRILVIKKDNQIIAQSWLWRNGDLLCLDNIEISKSINCVDFLDVYLQMADELINTSYQKEGINNCIKNITIGFNNLDKEIKGIKDYPCLISKDYDFECKDFKNNLGYKGKVIDKLPQPIKYVGYSDSKNVQYLIRGNGMFNLGQSNFLYQDDRNDVMHYSKDEAYDDDYLKEMNKKINALRYIKAEKEDSLESYKTINVEDLEEVYCNDDWYIIKYSADEIETFINSFDTRVALEISESTIKKCKVKKMVRI